ncbi:phosphodiester glycosidase family protein [Lactococcus protaetiae]|uniref:Exopolysaccharide biosynthesis protein n=1 Tax=Lactococcus protaetiae TaxID=2592653 RepID=A0A514Z8M5_9LACT|nr:phosphodiester glycosidase family protein [Lactococcus protaetiae]QDK70940.1 exopolysaccharide biosynthesis protein [Lactococcus protaetiae]
MGNYRKHKKSKYKHIRIIGIVILFGAIAFGIYSLSEKTFTNKKLSAPHIAQTNNSPKKTNEVNGYISSDSPKAVSGSMQIVANSGAPQWVKVPSNEQLNRFTDMSKDGLTIYRINNPEVLKTVTTLKTPRRSMTDIEKEYPNTLIMNASAFNMTTGQIVGFQINNGFLLNDWAVGNYLQYTFVINKNGSCKIYDSTTPASTIIKNGATQSYDFGTALIRDGKTVPSDGSVNWEIHAFIANDKSNNLYVILSDTNAGYDNIMKGVASLNLENMLLLDSGGSSQLSVNGKTIVASQDNRAVPDYIVMK